MLTRRVKRKGRKSAASVAKLLVALGRHLHTLSMCFSMMLDLDSESWPASMPSVLIHCARGGGQDALVDRPSVRTSTAAGGQEASPRATSYDCVQESS